MIYLYRITLIRPAGDKCLVLSATLLLLLLVTSTSTEAPRLCHGQGRRAHGPAVQASPRSHYVLQLRE
jgi:hypothetical protein